MMIMLDFVREVIKIRNLPTKEMYVSLENRNVFLEYPIILKQIRLIILAMVFIMVIMSFALNNAIAILLIWFSSIIIAIKQMSWI